MRPVEAGAAAAPAVDAELPAADVLERMYRHLVLLRVFDERALAYHRQGRIGTFPIAWGHEAIWVGSVHALDDRDWIFPSYRETAIGLLRGMPPATVLAMAKGHPEGWWEPGRYAIASPCIPVATHIPHAVGHAWGTRLRGGDGCSIAYFGDGATSEGAFHEGVNLAAVRQAPVVLLCNNNGWAISTPFAQQTRAAAIADKGVGYGIPAIRVDGHDVLEVWAATRTAVERARAGGGPTLIEAVTYRMAAHATADDPGRYLDQRRVEEERERECVGAFEVRLRALGLLDDELQRDAEAQAKEAVRAGMRAVEALPDPDPAELFAHVFAGDRSGADQRAGRAADG